MPNETRGECALKKIERNIVFEFIPTTENPRNSEGAFIDLKDGGILFAYSKYVGEDVHDDSRAEIASCVSCDGGHRWSNGSIMFTPEEHGAKNIMSVSLMRMANGDLGIFYLVKRDLLDTRLYVRRSNDEGQSWGAAIRCMSGPGYYEVPNDRVIRLSTGRLLVPAEYSRLLADDKAFGHRNMSGGTGCFVLSDDDGYSWRYSRDSCHLPVDSGIGLQEPGVLELGHQHLWAWFRTDMGYQYQSFSFDGGDTWSPPYPSRFTSPASPMQMKRKPDTEMVLAVWNPVPGNITNFISQEHPVALGRTPLVGAVSEDAGKTWGETFIIEDDPDRGFCYTAIHFVGDRVLLAYCAGGTEDKNRLSRTRICMLDMKHLQS